MPDGRYEDERWECLPLDCDFDADEDPDWVPQLPDGMHVVIVGRVARLAEDLPDIAEWNA